MCGSTRGRMLFAQEHCASQFQPSAVLWFSFFGLELRVAPACPHVSCRAATRMCWSAVLAAGGSVLRLSKPFPCARVGRRSSGRWRRCGTACACWRRARARRRWRRRRTRCRCCAARAPATSWASCSCSTCTGARCCRRVAAPLAGCAAHIDYEQGSCTDVHHEHSAWICDGSAKGSECNIVVVNTL